jgi:hypothetical protein
VIPCAHARDFISATDSLLLRTSLSLSAASVQEITAWRAELENDTSKNVFFQFPEQRNHIYSLRGERVDSAAVDTTVAELSALVKFPERRQAAATSSKAKKKKTSASHDNWDVVATTTHSTSGGDFLSRTNGEADTSRGYLKTLEYGEIADVLVLQSLGFSAAMTNGSPALTVQVSSSPSTRRVHVHADALVVVSQSASIAHTVASLRAELLKQVHHSNIVVYAFLS